MKKTNAIIIMDGFGYGKDSKVSAIAAQGTPNITKLSNEYPFTTLGASGMSVGLPDGQMGNSEVGHLNIGAGRIVYQELTRISKAIDDGDFYLNPEILAVMNKAKQHHNKLHVMGLLSDGGVHSHNTHLYALIKMAKEFGLENIYIHVFLDGRDVSPTSGSKFIKELNLYIDKLKFGCIATVMGRYYSMDRDNRWDRVEKAYNAMVNGTGEKITDAKEYVDNSYKNNVTDEFIVPAVVCKNGEPAAKISKNDSVIFFNFRPDRAREITAAFTDKNFTGFKVLDLDLNYLCMTQYDATFKNVRVAFLPQSLDKTLGQYLSEKGLTQLRIAETEKYAHVTFFFNGGVETPNKNEDRVLIKSPLVATYDLQPEMSALEVTGKVIELINSDKYDVIILNFANCDMVGHTGIFKAAVKAVEAVDNCVQKVAQAILGTGGNAIITADHGNADQMYDFSDGSPFTAHTINPVPFILVSDNFKNAKLRSGGILADIAPTLLDIMNLEIPKEMTGKSLITKN